MRHTLQHHAVGIEAEADDFAVVQALFDIHRQQLGVGILPAVGLQQQRFQHRFIGRVDAFIELPQAGAEVLFRRQRAQTAEIEPLVRRQHALCVKRHHIVVVVMLFFARHHIPQDAFARHAHGGAIELVEQQNMLRRAAVFSAKTAAFVMAEAVFINQEEADLHAHRHAPLLQQRAFALQVEALFVIQP